MSKEQKGDNNIDKNKFVEYANIKNQIKELTLKSKEIEKEVFQKMKEIEADKVNSDFGTFSIVKRSKYTYPEYVTELENKYKIKKKESEKNGDAKVELQESLMFRAK